MRHPPEPCQLAAPQLVEDLSRLLLGVGIDLSTLVARQQPQRADGHVGVEAQRLQPGDDPVAAERRRVPRDARGRIRPGRLEVEQRSHIAGRALEQLAVEPLTRGRDAGAVLQEALVALADRLDGLVEVA